MLSEFLQDAFFAAIAAIGFAAISNPPRRAYLYCAIIAAVGHSARFLMMQESLLGLHIVIASTLAALIVGMLAVLLSPVAHTPAETCLFPSLLPMIPGIYAYKTFGGLVMCLYHGSEDAFDHYFYLFVSNGLTCLFILLGMVIGATIPIFLFKNISFQATR
ncbi:threonine/serine exporter family protein [uncultured Duncaniella sp.]|uniref:threonine/serine exporter family protein n=1 Tax=uncultured Duncaniella sp. TaxID=2768039 RepID=UPI0025FC1AA4|nr:threonine/serine exporter family protein [uncultured Duncaniella sp.]